MMSSQWRVQALRLVTGIGLLLPLAASAQSTWMPLTAPDKSAAPAQVAALQALPAGSVSHWQRGADKARAWILRLPDGSRRAVQTTARIVHANGDVSYSGTLRGADGRFGVVLTEGREASFGRVTTAQGDYYFEAWGQRGWLVDLGHPDLRHGASAEPLGTPPQAKPSAVAGKATGTVIDLLMLYSEGFAARYPGSATLTRINHLVALSNQMLADSGVDLGVRLVGAELSAYPDSEGPNDVLLERMRNALQGQTTHPALSGMRQRRNDLGADVVSFLRPMDIESRGSCGIARLFGEGAGSAVNVVAEGFSSWSLCGDEVLMHELGHNLGAEHQNGHNSGRAGYGTALVLPGRMHTLMGSFGTGQPDRQRRLDRFSNPQLRCAGVPCGEAEVSDNARRVRENMAAVAAYQGERSNLPKPQPLPARNPDSDGDGVGDNEDAFPFEVAFTADRDGDSVADELDAFPDSRLESADRDADGIGDNSDPDRDNDGRPNVDDALPLDPQEQDDSDGDGVGDHADAFVLERSEWRDGDLDGIGDNADSDRDNDGWTDVAPIGNSADSDLLVISAGNDRVIRLRGDSGRYTGIEIAESFVPQAFGFQSALAWNAAQKRLYALAATELRRYQRHSGQRDSFAIGYYGGPRPPLPSAFPAGLAVGADGTVFIADEVTRSLARLDAVSATAQSLGVFGQVNLLEDAARGLALAANGHLWSLQSNGRLLEVDSASGELLRTINPRTADGSRIGNATALVVDTQQPAVLIADAANHRVLRVSTDSVRAAEVLIAPGAGGLDAPAGLAIGPDGRLYVSSAGNDRILRYDLASGAFIDVFSQVPAGRLLEPRGLLFVPKVTDRYPDDPSQQLRPSAGAWYDPTRSGQGFDLQLSSGALSLIWYSYTATGEPIWYLAAAPLQGQDMSAPWLRFRWDGQQAVAEQVGDVQIHFNSETSAQLQWRLGELHGEQSLQPLWLGGTEESAFPTAAWYPPGESGWGLSLARGGDVHSAIAFLYDPAGQPTWVAGAALDPVQPLSFAMNRFTSRNLCPGCSGPADAEATAAGELRMRILDHNRAAVDSQLLAPNLDWVRQQSAFQRLTDSPTSIDGAPQH